MRFQCQRGCIRCCEQKGFVYLTRDDIARLAAHLGLSQTEFRRRYLCGPPSLPRFRKPRGRQCPFLLADGCSGVSGLGELVVIDPGGATTDVHSVVELEPEDANRGREVVATHRVTRTVEGDLGMRWNAVPVAVAGIEAGLVTGDEIQEWVCAENNEPYHFGGNWAAVMKRLRTSEPGSH